MDSGSRERAKERVGQLKGFYIHLLIFIVINAVLILINILTSPGNWWFYWVTIFWGIGLAFQAVHVFGRKSVFSREWEENKIRQYIEEEESHK